MTHCLSESMIGFMQGAQLPSGLRRYFQRENKQKPKDTGWPELLPEDTAGTSPNVDVTTAVEWSPIYRGHRPRLKRVCVGRVDVDAVGTGKRIGWLVGEPEWDSSLFASLGLLGLFMTQVLGSTDKDTFVLNSFLCKASWFYQKD